MTERNRDMVNALKSTRKSVRGIRYELEGAAHLIRNGHDVVEITRRIRVGPLRSDTTDIDVVVQDVNDKLIYYQFKSSRRSFGTFAATVAWVKKALKDLPAGATFDQIRFAVPDLDAIPPRKVKKWLESRMPPVIFEVISITQ